MYPIINHNLCAHRWSLSGGQHEVGDTGFAVHGLPRGRRNRAVVVPRRAVAAYPTNFAAMSRTHFEAITTRGEQLMRTVLPMYLRSSQR
ncbi:hypothetical protein OOK27_49165 [Streptomyces canus]|jgi:NTE family protein|uniref:hypothetical protein n=1 Tax=Streptomyces canus TaxID=58343 RepID=UPI00225B5B13|nr:hypothetical protein [Streptomyces canus]MCX5256699.1 hypothetical protein [Streptomyces canus]MCX5261825.1 hypothetical protein [Streptomyces canus]MCX5262012.1 hypothetical protein [Streptomyces canus]